MYCFHFAACPRGTFKSRLEPSKSCTPCPSGSTTADVASTKLSDCYCKEGYVGDPSKGIPCKGKIFHIMREGIHLVNYHNKYDVQIQMFNNTTKYTKRN